jgi:hypothetical protein
MMLALVVAAVLLPPVGDAPFGPTQVVTDAPLGPAARVAADLDGDGDRDILFSSSKDDLVGWFENGGSAEFIAQAHLLPIETRGPYAAVAADVDGDGDLDVLAGFSGKDTGSGPRIAWFENQDGAGSFGAEQSIGVPSYSWAAVLLAADLDADGDQDVVHGGWGLVWQRNDGPAGFGAPQVLAAPGGVKAAVADMDVDGDLDLLICRPDSAPGLVWHPNDGLGSFGPPLVIDAIAGCSSVDPLDLDLDGDTDLLASAGSPLTLSAVVCHRNLDGAGATWTQTTVWASESFGFVAAADLDDDGDDDAVSVGYQGVRWFEHLDGAGSFGPGQLVPGTANQGIGTVEDLDGDGQPDLLSYAGAGLTWWPNQGSGFGAGQPISPLAYSPVELRAADIDGDGATDLVVAEASRATIIWFPNAGGSSGFGTPRPVAEDSGGDLRVADLDGDGDLDVVTALFTFGFRIVWYENDGRGGFAPEAVLATPSSMAFSLACVDVDGDTDLDLLTAFTHEDQVAWYEHLDGAVQFGGPHRIASADFPTHLLTADLDGDADVDVVYELQGGQTVWQANTDGLGAFGPAQPVTTTTAGGDPADTADIDGDGDLDVLFFGPYGEGIGWWRNADGAGLFEGFQMVAWVYGPRDAVAADVDADGDQDVVAVRYLEKYVDGQPPEIYAGAVGWYENVDGSGVFQGPKVLGFEETVFKPATVVASDLDGDGDLDVAASSSSDHSILWWQNLRAVWIDLGAGLAGAAGVPQLGGRGTLAPGSSFELSLASAAPGSVSHLVIGPMAVNQPFLGGVLVPQPAAILFGLPTDAQGEWHLESTWPAAFPEGSSLILQCWVADATAPVGWSASNALQAAPP